MSENAIMSVRTIETMVVPVATSTQLAEIRKNESLYPRYRSLDQQAVKNWLYKQMALISTRKALGWTKEISVVMVEDLNVMIMNNESARNLTAAEISAALQRGSCGIYGENYRVDVEAMMRWISSFIKENLDAYKQIVSDQDKERRSKMGQHYVDKVRQHAEEVRLAAMQEEALKKMEGRI